jgi:mannose-6-phosphate isomerase-like protein (cupin superfamily)
MSSIGPTAHAFGSPDDQAGGGRVHIEVVDLGELKVKRQTYPPGWRHSNDTDGRPRCNDTHVGRVVSGHIHIALEGGEELDIRSGDVVVIPPGHDAWTAGDEPCVVVHPDEGASASRRFGADAGTAKAA